MPEPILEISQLSLSYHQQLKVLDDISLHLLDGEIACLLGQSGCGKTSLLRAIAGFEKPSDGAILLRQQALFSINEIMPIEQRNVGMVFQDYALFPHLNVAQNISFGLKRSGSRQQENTQRLHQILELLELSAHSSKFPHQLSGGQQQRVAIGRAIITQPDLLLLDEPFSNLDVYLRDKLAYDLRQLLKSQGISALMVTHDQEEAFSFADRIAVMHEGKIEQYATAKTLYNKPASAYVANFIGRGEVLTYQQAVKLNPELQDNRPFYLFRPEQLMASAQGAIEASLVRLINQGHSQLLHCRIDANTMVYAKAETEFECLPGETIKLQLAID